MKIAVQFCRVLLAIGLLAAVGLAAEKPPGSGGKSTKNSKTTKAQPTVPQDQHAWEDALGQVSLLAAKFQGYRDMAVASRSLAGLASVVCQYDKTLAPVFFSRAFELVQVGLKDSETSANKEQLWGARAIVISSAAQCDPQLAEHLNGEVRTDGDGKTDPRTYSSDLRTALMLLSTDEAKAIQFAEAASRHVLDFQNSQLQQLNGLIWELRKQSPSAADQLFVHALAHASQHPTGALRAVSVLGNYVFALAGAEQGDGIGVAPLGNEPYDPAVYLFQVQRAAASPLAVHAFLEASVNVLSNFSPSTQNEAAAGFSLAHQLRDLSERISPGFVSDYEIALQQVSPLLQDNKLRSQMSRFTGIRLEEDLKSSEERLEKETDPRKRDEIKLSLFQWRWMAKEVLKAETLVAAIEDEYLKSQLTSLLIFRKVQMALENKDLEQGQALARTLKSPLQRTLAFLGIAQQQQEDPGRARDALNLAIREIEKTDAECQPYLLVSAAALAAPHAVEMALRNLEDAVAGFNRLDVGAEITSGKRTKASSLPLKPHEPISASDRGFVEIASAGDTWRHFNLEISQLSFNLSDTAKALRSSPPEHLSAVLLSLQSEARQGPALAAAAKSFLQRAKPNKVGSSKN